MLNKQPPVNYIEKEIFINNYSTVTNMKLLVKDLWFNGNVDEYLRTLFQVPHMAEFFDQGYEHTGQMRPQGIKWGIRSWQPKLIVEKLPDPGNDVYMALTSRELFDMGGRSVGYSNGRRLVATNYDNVTDRCFPSDDLYLIPTMMEEIGHALGVETHHMDKDIACVMQGHKHKTPDFQKIEQVQFCNDCYDQIKS